MNLQSHVSGQSSGQLQIQAGSQLSGLQQQNGNLVSGQMQNHVMQNNVSNMDIENFKIRKYLQEKIWEFLTQRRPQNSGVSTSKMMDLVKRLEESLYNDVTTKEEYLNLATLESRLHVMIKRLPMSNPNQQIQRDNSTPSIGTMIPTPGLQPPGNSNLIVNSSLDGSLAYNSNSSSTVYSGSFLPPGNGSSGNVNGGSFSSSDGLFNGGYQQSAAFSANSGGNNMITSMGGIQRMTSQMIPTPGFNSSGNNDVNDYSKNQPFFSAESSGNVGAFPAIQSQPIQQKQNIGGQNSRILHNLGGPMGGGIRSTLQQKSHGLPNGPLNGGLGIMGNNMSVINGPGTTEGYLTGSIFGNSPGPMHQNIDQNQRPVMQGDGYGVTQADASGSGNVYVPVTSGGSMMNNQSLNAVSLQSMPKSNPSLMTNQSSAHSNRHMTTVKPQLNDQVDKMNFQSQYSVRENPVQPHQSPPAQQSHQFQHQQLIQHQAQQKQQSLNQLLLKNNTFSQSQLSNLASATKSWTGTEHCVDGLQSQVSNTFQFSDMQNQFPQNFMEDNSRATQLLSHPSGPQDVRSSLIHTSEQMQQSLLMKSQQFTANPQNDFGGLSCGTLPDTTFNGQWYAKSEDVTHLSGRQPHDQNMQNEFNHRLTVQQTAHVNNLSSEESMIGEPNACKSAVPQNTRNAICRSNSLDLERQHKDQMRWLLLLFHARRCSSPEGQCAEFNCLTVQKMLKHMQHCEEFQCVYPRCHRSKGLIKHYKSCRDASCPLCIPLKNFFRKAFARSDSNSRLPGLVNGSCNKSYDTAEIGGRQKTSPVTAETLENEQSFKRMKIAQGPQSLISGTERLSAVNEPPLLIVQNVAQPRESHIPIKSETTEVKLEVPGSDGQPNLKIPKKKEDNFDHNYFRKPEGDSNASNIPFGFGIQEIVEDEKKMPQAKIEVVTAAPESASKSGKPKIKGVSLTELFTPEQVREHIRGLRQWVGQSKAKVEKNQAMEHSMSENCCQLCAVEKLTFEPPPLYCTPCGARIKRNAMYYTIGSGENRYYFCIPCYNEARGDTITVEGTTIAKGRMEKRKNDEETEESWVQCDKCEAWQHQVCTLFNGRRNDGGQAEYTCPNCYIAEVERGEREPLPEDAVLGAKDLPKTILSDHLEQRLFGKLKQEKLDRARVQGKHHDEVPGADSLVVRVVSSVDKKLDVKPRFLKNFQDENYPVAYPYKSKVVLLFQKIEGVEVCLFGMYVQEFGSECQQPNHRRVYLSYLDSVKYFRPDVRAVTGEALRTFVYHEILIGYLEYCKMRGFTSCYIWACPPLKGEDYILYCHPEIQKTPKSDKLREWYLAMLRKATKENIVVELTNLYDHFFVSNGESKAKITATRLPYFDGDYWPGAAEDMIFELQQEEDGGKQYRKGSIKKTITKRALKASGQTDLSGNATKDLMLMHRLGETISPMKEDFIMVHLQHACTHCCILMVSGNRWVCKQCKRFELCARCYDAERKRDDRERHPMHHKDKHTLYSVEITGIPDDTKDKDEILESEFFDTRQAFLSLCQGNHYQYDTLRRAKHSSMMVLYHLHNPTAPAFVMTCNICTLDIETGQGWCCETCAEYDVCNACYQKGIDHPHKLTNNPSSDRDAQNKEARQMRVMQLKKMLELLVHASQCRSPTCQYPNCRKVKGLFRHGMGCKTRASGGCVLCKKMWYLLQLHSRSCKQSECNVPRCRDLKEHMRRLQQQSDHRRRVAVMEMMKNRTAEVAGSS